MKSIELIKFRIGNRVTHELLEELKQLAEDANRDLKEGNLQFYRHASVTGDFAYLLCWHHEVNETEGSILGMRIRKSLESWGIVDYSIWKLFDQSCKCHLGY